MKTNLISILIVTGFILTNLFACESHEKKADDAFEIAKAERGLTKETDTNKKAEVITSVKYQSEWSKFKMAIDKEILSNEKRIKDLRSIPNASSSMLKKVSFIEKENNNLKKQMDVYNEEVKLKWENFKVALNHDLNEIIIELKDLKTNNKK